jgi:choice-of-anchor A domain-containing protein
MNKVASVLLAATFAAFPAVCRADTAPFGVASAYNLVALTGNVSTTADVTGRIASAGSVAGGTTIGSSLGNPGNDPWGSLATFDLVGTTGITGQYNINSHGNVFTANASGASFNFNGGGHLTTTGSSGIDFASLNASLDSLSGQLGNLLSNGTILQPNSHPGQYGNPQWEVLVGTDPSLNVFNIPASDLGNTIDIEVPDGSTVIINVTGTAATSTSQLYYKGQQHSGDDPTTDKVLFNFDAAQTVTIDGQFDASILAPYAYLSGDAQMGGTFIAASIGQTGEVHNIEFTGTLPLPSPQVPEPASLMLVGTGIASAAAVLRRLKR